MVSVQVFADSGSGSPGTLLQTLITPLLDATPGTIDNATFTSPSPLILAAGTEYWFILSNNDPNPNNGIQWAGNVSGGEPTGVATCSNFYEQRGSSTFIEPCASPFSPEGLAIRATPVAPEPASVALMATGLLVLLAFQHHGMTRRLR